VTDDSPYHLGEREVQARAGVRERAEQLGRRMIRDHLTDQHRAFFAKLPFVLVGSVDDVGRPWASLLHGAPGFMHALDERRLAIDAVPHPEDPLQVREGRPLGLLGIELETRRRNRVNGRVLRVTDRGFVLSVEQSFGNCPQYITEREPEDAARGVQPARRGLSTEETLAWIRSSDTCFIASASSSRDESMDRREGVDVSHRGGEPGFVRVEQQAGSLVLTLPDYAGNNAFNTLGNLARYPRAGLSFPNFLTGDWLQLSGRTELIWDEARVHEHEGAQRLVRLTVDDALMLPGWIPRRWT
jgi:predicted pyridoxine 5'-phosphate oxidase superfamily flavin-nucleotide-binding protein